MHSLAADFVEYLPALHSRHELAPPSAPVLVIEPASHVAHAVLPVLPEYVPAWQSPQASTDAAEYWPAAHAVHVVAPVSEPVFVTEPAPHSAHGASVDAAEYVPAPHAVQFVAPGAAPVSVIEPA